MEKKAYKKVRVPFTKEYVEVTAGTPEIYKITLTYIDGYEESYYRSFYDEDDAGRYCIKKCAEINDCVDYKYEFINKIGFKDNKIVNNE